MGRLIIDGNSFFEIDEECLKRRKNAKKCGLDKYLKEHTINEKTQDSLKNNKKKTGDG